MVKYNTKTNNLINSNDSISIYNILRQLGLLTTLKGTKLLNKAIQICVDANNEFIVLEDIYKKLTLYYIGLNNVQIRNAIKYAIDNRDEQKSKLNFEKIFGYEYDDYYFTNKIIIEEISRIIKQK